ncbi:mannosyltransferase family protein [Planomonospora parontospora]|uniref:mannosyltransferase family protein n=1 Tax=Planomonospora parontospora TaxID=58119 RepID=UPI0019CD4BF2|nr:mannosyltransferase family protein [Planomonospora parontospora]GGL40074.1 membrane protein [Planomonospora parontospora subsp. antibiotica]GII16269.1 membrane protein [Planomonospora parontospora subsp. antibiotica]
MDETDETAGAAKGAAGSGGESAGTVKGAAGSGGEAVRRSARTPQIVGAEALALWVASRLGIVVLAAASAQALLAEGGTVAPFPERWKHWDAGLLAVVAEHGYGGDPSREPDEGLPAFFPGMPLALRAVSLITGDWWLAGLLISLVAGAVAVVALARLAEFEGPPGAGWRAVLALLLWPMSVFLFAGYSESLFLAFAIPAWLAARRGRWPLAVLLAAGASCVRITGLFLALALIVEFAVQRRPLREAPWLAVPFLPLAAYSAYQYGRTGDWMAWKTAQEAGWGRTMVWPWESLSATWDSAMGDGQFAWAFRMELAGAAVGVALVAVLLLLRRWSEFVYVGLQVGALICSAYYLSIPRSALLWWPLFLLVARASTPGPRWRTGVVAVYALVLGPLAVFHTMSFMEGAWVG